MTVRYRYRLICGVEARRGNMGGDGGLRGGNGLNDEFPWKTCIDGMYS